MGKKDLRARIFKLLRSGRAIAIPVTFLMLFVSLTVIVSVTYYFSMTKISTKASALRTSGAEQEMLSLEKTIKLVVWSPGAHEVYDFGDFGGKLKVQPASNRLLIDVSDNATFHEVAFNSSIGKVTYELSTSEPYSDVYFIGDSRPIVNQSSSTITQLGVSQGNQRYEITLSYRPQAGSTSTRSSDGGPVNSIRIYIVNLNSSQVLERSGSSRLKVTCLNVTSSWKSYNFSGFVPYLLVSADLNGVVGQVSLPISNNELGTVVDLETVVCNIKIEEVSW
jgi:hypothetical protein